MDPLIGPLRTGQFGLGGSGYSCWEKSVPGVGRWGE